MELDAADKIVVIGYVFFVMLSTIEIYREYLSWFETIYGESWNV